MNTTVAGNEKFFGCWASIIASVVFVFALTTAFNLLGLGSGFISLANVDISNMSVTPMSLSVFIWLLATSIVTLFLGGWLSGYFVRTSYEKNVGVTQGLMTWALSTIILFTALTLGAGVLINGVSNLAGGTLKSLQAVSSQFNLSHVTNFISDDMKNVISNKFGDAQLSEERMKQLGSAILSYLSNDDREDLRQQLTDNLAQATGKTPTQVNAILNDMEKSYDEAVTKTKEKAQQAISAANKTVSAIMFALFIINVLNAMAAIAGGAMGYRQRLNR